MNNDKTLPVFVIDKKDEEDWDALMKDPDEFAYQCCLLFYPPEMCVPPDPEGDKKRIECCHCGSHNFLKISREEALRNVGWLPEPDTLGRYIVRYIQCKDCGEFSNYLMVNGLAQKGRELYRK